MKKILFLFFLIASSVGMISCEDEDGHGPKLSFERAIYILKAEEPLEVTLFSSEEMKEKRTVAFDIAGTAVLDEDYTLSAKEFQFETGQHSAKIVVEPKNNLHEGREIKLALRAADGFQLGSNRVTMIPIEMKERFSCSFAKPRGELTQRLEIDVHIQGELNEKSTPSVDMHIPFELTSGTTAVRGTHFLIEGDADEVVVPAGKRSGKIVIEFLTSEVGKDMIELELKPNERFFIGDYNKIAIKVVGPSFFERLEGKWAFKEFASREFIEAYCEYPGDLTNMPLDNRSTDMLEFIAGEKDEMKVHIAGDLRKYFRDCEVTFLEEMEDEVADLEEVILLPYMQLSKANVNFSDQDITERPVKIGMRVLDNGQILEIHIVDFEPTEFLQDTYLDWGEEIAYFYRMRYLFRKVQ